MDKVWAHVLVKNEARFVWYSVQSVLPFVDKVLIYDTGSTDGTIKILDTIVHTNEKVIFKKINPEHFDEQRVRQQMLDETQAEWFVVVDGDEIWWNDSIKKVVETIKHDRHHYESIVVSTVNPVGDIYHYQEKQAGNYTFFGKTGHYAIRAINMATPGLHSSGEHGVWGWVDESNEMIQNHDQSKILFLEDVQYLHTTYLERTSSRKFDKNVFKRAFKLKAEVGIPFPPDYFYPESFFYPRPHLVESVWQNMETRFYIKSLILTPLRKLKRRIMPRKVGY